VKRLSLIAFAMCLFGLLPAAAQTNSSVCQLAPAPRLHEGMIVIVSPQIGQLNLRALPAVDTGIETALYQGNQLTVLAGPSCNGHYFWWRVETANGRRGWVAEGSWERYYLITADEAAAVPPRYVDPVEYACPERRPILRRCLIP